MSVETVVNEMKSPGKFDAKAVARGATMAQDKEKVYTDAGTAHELNEMLGEIADLRLQAETEKAKAQSIEGSPEGDALNEQADVLEAEVEKLVKKIQDSALTFHMRGLAPEQFRLIDKKWRRKIKPPVRDNYPNGEEGTEEFEVEALERNIDRNNAINWECVAKSITKVVDANGDEDNSAWTVEDVQGLHGRLLEIEWEKLRRLSEDLTHAHTIFNEVIVRDADFLQKP